jgi:hypothetical protein
MTGKTFHFIIFALILLGLLSCKSDSTNDHQHHSKSASATKNADGVDAETLAMIARCSIASKQMPAKG